MKRRDFLVGAGIGSGAVLSYLYAAKPKVARSLEFPTGYPFSLGVASGDPGPTSVVIWTRIASDPLGEQPVSPHPIVVRWQVAADEAMRRPVAQGTILTSPKLAHAVHVVVNGLAPSQWYWYQFQTSDALSPIGRTRTTSAAKATPNAVTFAFVSCQNYEHGYFNAYRHLIQEDIQFVVHLGDYIYEAGGIPKNHLVRLHSTPEVKDLDGYRRRYAQYRLDPDLQEAHRLFPFICTWDDHEVENDYAQDQSQTFEDPKVFHQRRAAAYQAYYEHIPLRPESKPKGANLRLYRRFQFGDLMSMHVLDTRQYRSDQACAHGKGGLQLIHCQERLEPKRSLLGQQQEQWLANQLTQSKTLWNVIAQQYLVSELKQGRGHWSDAWDGYPACRQRLLNLLHEQRVSRPIFLGGDFHSFWVSDVKLDCGDPDSAIVASEFVGTSISSHGIPYELIQAFLLQNPHIKFFESRLRGYVRCTVTRDRWRSDLQVVDTVKRPQSSLQTLASFEVDANQPGVQRA
jgi:alkaline phosphatase D